MLWHVQHMTEFQNWVNKIGAKYQELTRLSQQELNQTMKLTIDSSTLVKALEQAARFVRDKPLMPILGNLKLVATDALSITGFDLSHGIEIDCDAEVIDCGSVCIPASAIAIIKGMAGRLIIETNETNLITISNLSGKVEIQGMPVGEYPELIDEDFDPKSRHELDAKSFAQVIKYCAQSTSTDETKAVLTGINITASGGNLRAIATDGHRLTVVNIPVDESIVIESITIPSKSLSLVPIGSAETIALAIDKSQISIDAGSRSIMRVLDGKYPDAMLLIPKSFTREMTIDRRELIDALNMMSAISDANNLVKFAIEETYIDVSASSDGKKGTVDVGCSLKGDSIETAFNLKYLLDGLKMFDTKQVKISMNDRLQPVIITAIEGDLDLTYLCMPVQIRS